MLKGLFLGVVYLFTFNSTVTDTKTNSTEEIFCSVTCTISVPDGFGGSIGFSATAGNLFTDCQTARERACRKVTRKIMSAMM